MSLYFFADARSHWSFGVIIGGVLGKARKQLAISSIVLGCLVALVSSVTTGAVALDGLTPNIFITDVVVVGFILYELGTNALATSFLRDKKEKWLDSYRKPSWIFTEICFGERCYSTSRYFVLPMFHSSRRCLVRVWYSWP